MKICVYTISLDEAQHVKRFCDAARAADLILIADTGSTDGTPRLAAKAGALVHDIGIKPWRFDDARNTALALVPRDIDVCVSIDMDEVLQPGWREEIERVWNIGITNRLRYKFDWGCGIQFYYEKIHSRFGFRWHHPVHEYVVPDLRTSEVWAQTDMLLVVHQPDQTKSRAQYLDLLKVSVAEDPSCPHEAFYYSRELSFNGKWVEAIVEGLRYLALPRATNPNERCYAMRTIGRCYVELGDRPAARVWLHKACDAAPNTREPWCELAGLAHDDGDWRLCYDSAMRALSITDREAVYTVDPSCWLAKPWDYASLAAWNLGMQQEALASAIQARALEPTDARLVANVEAIERALAEPGAAEAA